MAIFDGNLKQRLIGALVLIVLAIVFLPMILNNKGEEQADTVVTIPEAPAEQATINQIPQNTTPAPQATQPTTHPTQTSTSATPQTVQTPTTAPVQQVQTAVNAPVTATTTPKANEITPSWTVQVAAVSSKENASAFTNKLRKANYNAYMRMDGKMYRIFVGPFVQKTEAARVQKLIEKQFREKGIIREFKPEAN